MDGSTRSTSHKTVRAAPFFARIYEFAMDSRMVGPRADESSEIIGPTSRAMIDTQNLDRAALQAIGDKIGRLRDHQLAVARNAARTPHLRTVRQQLLDVVDDADDDAPRGGGIVRRNVGSKRDEVLDRLWRPNDVHFL